MTKYFTIALLFLCSLVAQAQTPVPAQAQAAPVVILHGTLHVGNGQVIEDAYVRFEGGKITAVGTAAQANTGGATVVDATGQHIYPGLILPHTILGLVDIEALRQTQDFADPGDYNPHDRAIVAYNTDSDIIPTMRMNGILLAQTTPKAGILSGSSSVVQLDAWNWEDAAYKTDDAIHMNWPGIYSISGNWLDGSYLAKNERRAATLAELNQFFADAVAYNKTAKPEAANTDLRFESMRGLFNGTVQLFVQVNFAKEIIEAVEFAKKYGVKKIVIVGGQDSYMVADYLKENNVPVVITRVFELPNRKEDDVDLPFKLPVLLQKAGVSYCIAHTGNQEASDGRNLPFGAGYAVAHGLGKEQALSAITLNTAKILGIAERTGSVEVGKDANIVISKGDILDMKSNLITAAFIQGRTLQLSSKQTELYKKYETKYNGQK